MIRRPPSATRSNTLLPYTTLFRSRAQVRVGVDPLAALPQEVRAPVEVVVERGELRRRLALGGLDVGLEGLLAGKHALQLFQHRRELRLHVLHPRVRSEDHTSELQSLMRI